MFCIKCGKENKDDALFCTGCGEKLVEGGTSTASTQSYMSRKFSDNPILNDIKKFMVSPLVLIAVVLFTLSIVGNIANAGDIGIEFGELIEYIETGNSTLDEAIEEEGEILLDMLDNVFTVIMVIIMIPSIVICIGLWISIYTAFDKQSDSMATAGFTMIKVITIIDIVFGVIGLIGVFALFMTIITQLDMYSTTFLFWLIMLITLAALVFRIYYLKKIKDSIDCVVYSIQAQYPSYGVSKLVGGVLLVSGGFQVISALFNSGNASAFPSWCSAIATVLFALATFKYITLTEYMRKVHYTPNM